MKTVTIYSKNICPYCVRAKELLKSKGVQFQEINIENDDNLMQQMIERSSGRKSVPQIFIQDFHVGGCDDLYALEAKGELDKLLVSAM